MPEGFEQTQAESIETIRNMRESSWLDEDEQAALDALVAEIEALRAVADAAQALVTRSAMAGVDDETFAIRNRLGELLSVWKALR